MDLSNCITIDMSDYGLTGEVVMAPPPMRKYNWLRNQIGRRTKLDPRTGKPNLADVDVGDLEMLSTLAYVKSAPFPTDKLESFLAYFDKIDEEHPGASYKLYQRMQEVVSEIDQGGTSPLE